MNKENKNIFLSICVYSLLSYVTGVRVYLVLEYFTLVVRFVRFDGILFQIRNNVSLAVASSIALVVFLCFLELEYRLIRRIIAYFKDQAYLQQLARLRTARYNLFRLSVKAGAVDDFETEARRVIK